MLALIAFCFCATSGWTTIAPGEVGLIQHFGRFHRIIGPGLHLGWPKPFERLARLRPFEVKSVEIGFRTSDSSTAAPVVWESSHDRGFTARAEDESLLLTGDGQLVELAATAQYRLIADDENALLSYAFGIADPSEALRPLAESAVRDVISRRPLDELLAKGRREAETVGSNASARGKGIGRAG